MKVLYRVQFFRIPHEDPKTVSNENLSITLWRVEDHSSPPPKGMEVGEMGWSDYSINNTVECVSYKMGITTFYFVGIEAVNWQAHAGTRDWKLYLKRLLSLGWSTERPAWSYEIKNDPSVSLVKTDQESEL